MSQVSCASISSRCAFLYLRCVCLLSCDFFDGDGGSGGAGGRGSCGVMASSFALHLALYVLLRSLMQTLHA